MYFYLSLPVFSHWQGRLDPRAMILGRTTRGMTVESGVRRDAPGRGHPGDGHQLGVVSIHPTDRLTAGNGTEEIMKVRILIALY